MGKKEQILQQLASGGGFVSGQELCEMLGVSRTAVWKIIQKLKEEGYPIEAVTNKGYRLLSIQEADVFNREQIEDRLSTSWAGRPVVYMDETGSTNDDIFALAAQGYPHGTLAVTARQTAGKGRRGRTWLSPPDGNIYMSILIRPDLRPDATPMLTIVMALSVYQAAQDLLAAGPQEACKTEGFLATGPHEGTETEKSLAAGPREGTKTEKKPADCRFGIKWPNDIVFSFKGGGYRKLCGILTEMRMEDNEISAITIGTGLNVNQTEFPAEIAQNATSFALATGRRINRASLTASVWKHFEENYGIFLRTGDFTNLRPAYEEGLVNIGRAVHVLDPQKPFTGTAVGINERGALLVRPDAGFRPESFPDACSQPKDLPDSGTPANGFPGAPYPEDGSAGTGRPLIAVSSGEVSVRGVNGYV